MSEKLISFVERAISLQQGVVERKSETVLEALLPPGLADKLGCSELVTLTFGETATAHDGTVKVTFGSPFLSKLLDSCASYTPISCARIPIALKKSAGFDREISRSFRFTNCKAVFREARHITGSYILFSMKYSAVSDEKKEGLFSVAVDERTLTWCQEMSMDIMHLYVEEIERAPSVPPNSNRLEDISRKAGLVAQQLVAAQMREFIQSMTRRLERDIERLFEYYRDMYTETKRYFKRKSTSKTMQLRSEKLDAIEADFQRKVLDARERYSVSVRIFPIAAMRVMLDEVECHVHLIKGTRSREIVAHWNSFVKRIEPIACEGCLGDTYDVVLCNETHVLCTSCWTMCSSCGRWLCMVCSPKGCPKCA